MMNNNTLPSCPRCHKTVQSADAAFCSFCGAPISRICHKLPDGARLLLDKAEQTEDPAKRYAILCDAQQQYPDQLEVAEALLFHGRLHERSSRLIDFSVIKCYLWHMYLTPRDFSEEKKNAMREELFSHPQLLRCMELAEDGQIYLRRYLEKLGAEFVSLFMKSSNRYNQSFFGFKLSNRMEKVLADPMAYMMDNIRKDVELEPQQRDLLYDAIYRAFQMETGGDTRWVDELLEKRGCPVPVKM